MPGGIKDEFLRNVRSGDPISAKGYNRLINRANRIQDGSRAIEDADGIYHRRFPHAASSTETTVRVTGIKDDYLECVFYDYGTGDSSETVNVAMPYKLQKSAFDGETVPYPSGNAILSAYGNQQRTADDGSTTETQRITPEYWTAASPPCLLVARFIETGVLDENGDDVVWKDTNEDSRYWAVIS